MKQSETVSLQIYSYWMDDAIFASMLLDAVKNTTNSIGQNKKWTNTNQWFLTQLIFRMNKVNFERHCKPVISYQFVKKHVPETKNSDTCSLLYSFDFL